MEPPKITFLITEILNSKTTKTQDTNKQTKNPSANQKQKQNKTPPSPTPTPKIKTGQIKLSEQAKPRLY